MVKNISGTKRTSAKAGLAENAIGEEPQKNLVVEAKIKKAQKTSESKPKKVAKKEAEIIEEEDDIVVNIAPVEAPVPAVTPKKNFISSDKEGIPVKKDFKSTAEGSVKKDFKIAGGDNQRSVKSFGDSKSSSSSGPKQFKNREWGESDDDEEAPGKIEAKHDKDNMEKYIKNEKTVQALNKKGITYLFPIQEHCFRAIQAGKDLIGKDRTGSGKTLGFSLPLIEIFREQGLFEARKGMKRRQGPLIVVVVPTRELCIQVANEIASIRHSDNEFRVMQVYGGVDVRDQSDKIRDGIEILVGTPGRVIDQYERGALKFNEVRATVLDEADQMLNFGFQEDIEKIFGFIKNDREGQDVQNMLFSATMPPWVHEIASKFLKKDRVIIDLVKNLGNKTSEDVTHLAINCPYFQRTEAIGDVILCYGGGAHARVIIFCETKNEANDIMLKANIKQDLQVLHGDIPQKQREITFQGFREGKFKCLVATNVAARGLDIPEVDLIVQLEPPKEFDAYIHRAGRTGRAGKKGVCITFYTKKQIGLIERIENKCRIKMQRVGAPQPAELVKASQSDIKRNLMSVNKDILEIFKDVSQSLIAEFGAEIALERAIAYISGYTEKMTQRSLLCCLEGYITYIVRAPMEFRNLGYVWGWLKQNFPGEVTDRIKGMKKFNDSLGAVFDVAEADKEHFDRFIEEQAVFAEDTNKKRTIQMTIEVATEVPEIEEEQSGYGGNSYGNGGSFSRGGQSSSWGQRNGGQGGQRNGGSSQQRVDPKLKRELEIFVGGLGFDSTEEEISTYFSKNNVKFTSIKPLQGDDGKFKGIIFGMCQDHDTVARALALNGQKFSNRALRINMSAQKG